MSFRRRKSIHVIGSCFAALALTACAPAECNSLLGFGLPAPTGKAFVDKIWTAPIPSHDYWNGVLYMLGLLHVSGQFHLYY
jgi:hypothetical protein